MSLAGFEPAIPASERPQTQVLYNAATGMVHNITETNLKQGRVYWVKKI